MTFAHTRKDDMENLGGIGIQQLIDSMTEDQEETEERMKEDREKTHRHNVSSLRDTINFNRIVSDKAEVIADRYDRKEWGMEWGLFQMEDLDTLTSTAALFLMVPENAPFYEMRGEVISTLERFYTDLLHYRLHCEDQKVKEKEKNIEKASHNGRIGRMN